MINLNIHLTPEQIDRLRVTITPAPDGPTASFGLDPDDPFGPAVLDMANNPKAFAAAIRRLADRIDLAVGDMDEDAYRQAEQRYCLHPSEPIVRTDIDALWVV